MRRRKVFTALIVTAGIFVLGIVGTFVISLTAGRPANLGVTDGRLADAPDSPNCVSTQTSDRRHWIEPITFDGPKEEAVGLIKQVLKSMPGGLVVEENSDYVYAEFRSTLFRFVDDVEFFVESESGRIHFRSASRVGHSDLGANRKRMEQFRKSFERLAGSIGRSSSSTADTAAVAL